jgi:hypothetical protein
MTTFASHFNWNTFEYMELSVSFKQSLLWAIGLASLIRMSSQSLRAKQTPKLKSPSQSANRTVLYNRHNQILSEIHSPHSSSPSSQSHLLSSQPLHPPPINIRLSELTQQVSHSINQFLGEVVGLYSESSLTHQFDSISLLRFRNAGSQNYHGCCWTNISGYWLPIFEMWKAEINSGEYIIHKLIVWWWWCCLQPIHYKPEQRVPTLRGVQRAEEREEEKAE